MVNAANLKAAIESAGGRKQLAQKLSSQISFDTPVLSQQGAQKNPAMETFLALGKVLSNKDASNSGRLLVQSRAFGSEPLWVDCVSPVAGAGYGMFAPPGIGATVLIAKVPESDPPTDYVWLGCLYTTVEISDTVRSQPNDLNESSLFKGEVSDNISDEPYLSRGIPNEFQVYGTNNTPDSWILKHPCGHTFTLTRKITSDTYDDEMRMKTSGNKRFVMSDAPADAGGECILLIDENGNAIRVQSEHPDNPNSLDIVMGENISVLSKAGNIEHTIAKGSGNYTVDVVSKGDIVHRAHKESIRAIANKNIESTAFINTISQSSNTHSMSADNMALLTGIKRSQIQSPVLSVLWGGNVSVYSPGVTEVGGTALKLGGAISWTPFPVDPGYQTTLDPQTGTTTQGPAGTYPGFSGTTSKVDIFYNGGGTADRHLEVNSSEVKMYVTQATGTTETVSVSPGTISLTSSNTASNSSMTMSPSQIVLSVTSGGETTTMTISSTGVDII